MAEYESKTIAWLLKEIEKERLVLPAIQRDFIWPEDKICRLFDSLIRDYPIGTFLFWNIEDWNENELPLNCFVRCYDEQDKNSKRGNPVSKRHSDYIGVLDGQQRITSIYMGLCGHRRLHEKGKSWSKSSSFTERHLCLNVMHKPLDDEDSYQIAFKRGHEIKTVIDDEDTESKELWIPLSVVADSKFNPFQYVQELEATLFPDGGWPQTKRNDAINMLDSLRIAIHIKQNVNFYPAFGMNLSEVVDIFVRVNSGGEKLSASDLMLSIASGEHDEDIHRKISDALDTINSATMQPDGFVATKELFLTAGLMFVGAASLSLQKKENYTKTMVNELYSSWDDIVTALSVAARLIEYIGIKGEKMTSHNLILPVAYYVYINNLQEDFIEKNKSRKDRILIRQWILRAMVNSIFRDGTGSTLLRIRDVIKASKHDYFPLDDLMAAPTKRKLTITDDTIVEMLNYSYQDKQALPLLLEICKTSGGREYHVDHIWPKSKLTRKRELQSLLPTATDEDLAFFKGSCHRLANLQPLPAIENEEKGDKLFDKWIEQYHVDSDDSYFGSYCIPTGISYDFSNFKQFLEKREELLRKRIRQCLPNDFEAILAWYAL